MFDGFYFYDERFLFMGEKMRGCEMWKNVREEGLSSRKVKV